ncbi:Uncharacterized protein Focb16_v001759 [Fusarium oxysporum f. sp. cubense]|uniref:C2H2-type domain-containing protein n=2 Tax=Fusarium oxysporum TaxID=5507 RepID=A0A559L7N4_FUSOC|nr:Uncharacterized protein Focb16_v001759 [Fusarium oxysporum f. sp. cubense]
MAILSHLPGQSKYARHKREKQGSPKLLFVAFDGTWHGSVKSSKETVVSSLPDLISMGEEVRKIRVNGVGTDNLTDKILGGLGGWGTRRNVITAYRNIADDYNNGDRIIFCGYSRGAWAARYLAMIIECLGLVRDGDTEFFKRLYDACKKDPYLTKANKDDLRRNYKFWDDVQIDALCCFDTVGSLGIPLFGIAKPLSYLHRSKYKTKVIDHVPNNVKFAFHALALHETRSPYSPTYMCGHNVHQVFFLGDHGNMGKLGQQEGLVHAPLAWMVQQLSSHLGITFDEDKLKKRFPSCTSEGQTEMMSRQGTHDTTHEVMMKHAWCCPSGSIPGAGVGRLVIMGRKDRNPGMVLNYCDAECTDSSTSESTQHEAASAHAQVHIGARGRQECGFSDAVPGYLGVQPMDPNQVFYWKRRATGEQEVVAADIIREAKVGLLEARLLGLPAAAASHPECCGLNRTQDGDIDTEVSSENEETSDSRVRQNTQGSTDTPASNVSESYPDAQDFPFFFEAKYFLRDCNYKNCGQSFETGTERINHEVEAHNRCITCEMYFKARSALEKHQSKSKVVDTVVGDFDHWLEFAVGARAHEDKQKDKAARNPNPSKNIDCITCERKFEKASTMMKHVENGKCIPELTAMDIFVLGQRLAERGAPCVRLGGFFFPICNRSCMVLGELIQHAEGDECSLNVLSGPLQELISLLKMDFTSMAMGHAF